jgi:hypothetical protein
MRFPEREAVLAFPASALLLFLLPVLGPLLLLGLLRSLADMPLFTEPSFRFQPVIEFSTCRPSLLLPKPVSEVMDT